MKIVGWNIRNVSSNKLANTFGKTFQAYDLGNNVLDYMVNVAMGDDRWDNLWGALYAGLSKRPADIFVIIELKTSPGAQGNAVSGNCTNMLATVAGAMNAVSNTRGLTASYDYDFATPFITGGNETVGVIYNRIVFENVPPPRTAVLQAGLNYMQPRTPLMASLVNRTNTNVLNVVGVHAPPEANEPDGQINRVPVDFSNELSKVAALNPTTLVPVQDYVILGDFNCNPSSTYNIKKGAKRVVVRAFEELIGTWHYATQIPNGTLSSVRQSIDRSHPQPADYLSAAFDNLFYSLGASAPGTNHGYVLDLIGNARNISDPLKPDLYPKNIVSVLNAFNRVSDHLPVILEFA